MAGIPSMGDVARLLFVLGVSLGVWVPFFCLFRILLSTDDVARLLFVLGVSLGDCVDTHFFCLFVLRIVMSLEDVARLLLFLGGVSSTLFKTTYDFLYQSIKIIR